MKSLGIIIPVYNNLFYTEQLITSIKKISENTKNFETIYAVIVDNGSTDGTPAYVISDSYKGTEKLHLCYVNSLVNKGYGGGANFGIEYLQENYPDIDMDYLVCNNDMVFLDNMFDELYIVAYSREDIGIVGGKLLFPDGAIQHAGGFLNVFGWGQHFGGGTPEEQYLSDNEPREMEYCTGALLYIKKHVLSEVGLFDEQFEKGYFEEVDLQYRARLKGYKTFYAPLAKAIHYENVTSKNVVNGSSEDVKKLISDVNQVKFYKKRFEERKALYENIPTDDTHKILISSQIFSDWSFCGVMRNLARGLHRNGVDVSIAPVEYHYDKMTGYLLDWEIQQMVNKPNDYWNRTVLRSSEGDHMYLMPPGKQRIAHTTGESNIINPDWVAQLNNVDKVFTTSTFFRNVMLSSGVKKPIFVLPNSVDLKLFNPDTNLPEIKIQGLRSLNFVSMFHFGERKSPDILIKAFCNAFGPEDDVTLTIHSLSMRQTLERQGYSDIGHWIYALTKKHASERPPIIVTSGYISDDVIPLFLKNFDVFVLPTKAEGFGLPIIETGAMRIPTITTGYSGVLDLVDNESGWLIDYTLEDIPLQKLPYFQNYIGGKWAIASIDHLISIFREVYSNKSSIEEKGKLAQQKANNYSIENIGKLAKDLIWG